MDAISKLPRRMVHVRGLLATRSRGSRSKVLSSFSGIVPTRHITTSRPPLRVLAIGNTIIDTMLVMPTIPIDDKVWIDSKKRYVGGQGANAAMGMAILGLHVSFLTRLGDDDDAEFALRRYRELGMGVEHCISVPGCLTMSACVAVSTSRQERACLMHREPAMFDFDVAERLAAIDFSKFDLVYSDGHQTDLALPVARKAIAHGLPVLADAEVLDEETIALAHLSTKLVAPEKVVCAIANKDDPSEAVLTLANNDERDGRVVVATSGAAGSHGARKGDKQACHVPALAAPEIQVKDTTGAGDAYHAGMIAAISYGCVTLEEQMKFATRVAGASAETPGPVVSKEALARRGIKAP